MERNRESRVTAEGLDEIEEILLAVPGIDPFVKGQMLDYYDGILSFQGETASGQRWLATWLDYIPGPKHTHSGALWLYVTREAKIIDDAIEGRCDWREPWATAPEGSLLWVAMSWPETVASVGVKAEEILKHLADPGVR